MTDTYCGTRAIKPSKQKQTHKCSIAAFTAPSVLKALQDMANEKNGKSKTANNTSVNTTITSSNNSRNSKASSDSITSSSMNLPFPEDDRDFNSNSSPRRDSNSSSRFPSVPFSPVVCQAAVEKGSYSFDTSIIHRNPSSEEAFSKKSSPTTSDDSDAENHKLSPIEARIHNELLALSEQERQQVENDVNGHSPPSSPSFTSAISVMTLSPTPLRESIPPPTSTSTASLRRRGGVTVLEMETLDVELRKLLHTHPSYQELITSLDDDYVRDTSLRTKMLLAESYDCEKAALRLAKFLKLLKETFGPYVLARPIQLVDLTAEERQLQRRGLQQLFKFRDHSGRRIVGCFDDDDSSRSSTSGSSSTAATFLQSQLRVALYLIQVATDDDQTQKHGLVLIFMLQQQQFPPLPLLTLGSDAAADCSSSSSSRWSTMASILHRILDCAPVKVGALHICSLRDHDMEAAKTDLLNAFGPKERLRTRFHNGSSMEISMALNRYGIPTDRLPLKYDGTVKVEDHLQWIAIREAKEDAFRHGRLFDAVECPANMDILAGRGQLVRSHPGNVSFRRDFIQARSAKYNAAHSRDEKNEIAADILRDIAADSRRFLKQHPSGYWTELEGKVAKEKVMMAFREYRKSQRLEATKGSSASASSSPPLPDPIQHNPRIPPPSLPVAMAPSHHHPYSYHHQPLQQQQQQQQQPYHPLPPYPPHYPAPPYSITHGHFLPTRTASMEYPLLEEQRRAAAVSGTMAAAVAANTTTPTRYNDDSSRGSPDPKRCKKTGYNC